MVANPPKSEDAGPPVIGYPMALGEGKRIVSTLEEPMAIADIEQPSRVDFSLLPSTPGGARDVPRCSRFRRTAEEGCLSVPSDVASDRRLSFPPVAPAADPVEVDEAPAVPATTLLSNGGPPLVAAGKLAVAKSPMLPTSCNTGGSQAHSSETGGEDSFPTPPAASWRPERPMVKARVPPVGPKAPEETSAMDPAAPCLCAESGPPAAAQEAGLTPVLLKSQCLFREALPAIRAFLSTLTPPVCLLAHNGDGFDFPILMGELKAAGNGDVESVLGVAGLTCCDTLKAGHAVWPVLPPAPKRGRGSVAASKQNSYALDQLYKRFCGRRSNAHHAEQDCIDLMKVCHTMKGAFLNYVDGSAKLLADSRSAW